MTQVLEELRSIVTQPLMDEDSALVLNTGVHILKSTSFRNYQKTIKGFIRVLKQSYRGRVVWKTTPSLGKQTELYTGCCRRFHTEQVKKLHSLHSSYFPEAMMTERGEKKSTFVQNLSPF